MKLRFFNAALIALTIGSAATCSMAQGATATAGPVALPPGCCGQRMEVEGEVRIFQMTGETLDDGTVVPIGCRTEVYGNVMVVKGQLPAGNYRVEVTGSENIFIEAGKRIFDVAVVTTGTGPGAPEEKKIIGENVDLFALAGGDGKPYVIKGQVVHGGGTLKVIFTAKVDFAKFSSVRIFDMQGNKVAWAFAEDLADMLKLPGQPPVVIGPVVWKNASAPTEKRVADLVSRMSLREKVWQLSNDAPAIERLGLPGYNYWSEGLHGVARNGIATVFPQAIGMAASFDPELLKQVGDAISTEARAKYNEALKQSPDGTTGMYAGLTFWSPNINLFRDPRWGRGQETYGEDPLLTGRMGVAFIQGMQGNDPKYLKVAATAKHYAVHSGPEATRHEFDAHPPIRDFYESYLPQFEMAVREGKVASVMGAYNSVYGDPACASDLLLKNILRKQWSFDGYVVSDCGAIDDIWAQHKVQPNEAVAAASAVLAGCDLECGSDYSSLGAAVDLNFIGEGAVDTALSRVLASRFRLGLFDPPTKVRWTTIGSDAIDSPAHAELALKMARESIVLLKNDGLLPLDHARIKKIALVGPNGDGLLGLLGNYNGTPSQAQSVLDGMRQAMRAGQPGGGTVIYIKGCDNDQRVGSWQLLPDICLRAAGSPAETGFLAQWFPDDKMTGPSIQRIEKSVDFHGMVEWTVPILGAANGAVRWSGEFVAPADGQYKVGITGLSAYRWIINGRKMIDQWDQAATDPGSISAVRMTLKAGQSVPMVLEAKIAGGLMDLQLLWDRADLDLNQQIADRVKDADVIVFAGGIDGRMESEEGEVRALYEGFDKGDREAIELPALQTNLMKALAATGKPVVFVNMSGSAMAMPWEKGLNAKKGTSTPENKSGVDAIVQAWYPGQSGGRAVADVLFGDYNPSGKLPVTFYNSTADLPAFTDYAMAPGPHEDGSASKGRTYRYFTGEPEWSFGHGLSYTTFRYSAISLSHATVKAADTITIALDVTNAGQRDGEDVVQVYARPPNGSGASKTAGDALRRLVGFKRIFVAAGKTMHLEIPIPVQGLRIWDEAAAQYTVRPGAYDLEIGEEAGNVSGSAQLNVTGN